MDPARWTEVRRLFEAALDLPPGERAAFLARSCGADATLRGEVERLLAAHATDDGPAPPGTGELLAALAGDAPLAAGALLGTWRLLRPLGAGGMGEVWEAEQDRPRRHGAVKVVRAGPGGARAARRFRDEIDALARLEHLGIARILEAGGGEGGGRLWYAMELVPGARPLTESAGGRPWRERVALLASVCDAVEHGHRNGVIHRDLKPSNILVGADGRPRVIDFGVARLAASDDFGLRTQTGELVGTLASMSPEQLEGRSDVRSDVYALGVVLHELLTGRPPYDLSGLGLSEAARRVRDVAPPPPRAAAPELPVELDWIAARALEKDPELRYATAGALAEDLRRLLADEAVVAGAPTAAYRVRKFVRRHRVGVGLAALIVLLLLGGIVGTSLGLVRAREKEREARDAQLAAERSADEARAATARESEALARETRAREDAESSAAEAVAVGQFLVDMFERADPEQDGSEVRVYDALDRAESRMGGFLSAHPRAESTLRSALGQLDFKLGRPDQAAVQLRRALEVQRARGLSGPDEVEAELNLRQGLGQALTELGRFDEAGVELQAVVDARRGVAGDQSLAKALDALASLRNHQGRLDEAEALYREALAAAQAAPGADPTEFARVQGDLGGLLLDCQRYADAEPMLVSALDTLRRERGADHPAAITALNNLAGVRFQQRRYAEAADLMQEAYDLRSKRLPPDHRVLLATRANLATLRWALGKPDEAAEMLESVLVARLQREPPYTPELVTMLCNLGSIVRPRGDDAVRVIVARLLDAHVDTGADSLRSISPLENFARFLESWQLLPESLALWSQAVAARARLQPPDAPEALVARACRARLLAATGQPDEALAELHAVRTLAAALAPDDPRRALLDLEAARALRAVGADAEAEELLTEAVSILQPHGPSEPLQLALQTLIELCESAGRAPDATQWRERLAALSGGEAPR